MIQSSATTPSDTMTLIIEMEETDSVNMNKTMKSVIKVKFWQSSCVGLNLIGTGVPNTVGDEGIMNHNNYKTIIV